MGARWSGDPAAAPTTTPGENDAAKYKDPISQATPAEDVHQKHNVFSKDTLEFLFGMSSESGEGSDEIVITNHKSIKVKYKIDAAPSTQCVITANPATGSIAPGKEKKVKLKADVKDKVNLSFKLTVHVGIESHFLNVRVRSLTGVFGTDPTTLDMVEDEDLVVPEVLVLMKRSLIASDGLKSEGIFRLAGDVFEIAALKDQMNKKTFDKSDNINTVATLIKVWYRELPEPILNKVPTSSIYYSTDSDRCIEAYRDLAEPYKTLLTWLLDLLCLTTQHSAVNRMTPQNLAIVVAPNLYDTSSSDPMEGLVMSQKVVQFVNNILLWYLERKTGSVPTHAPAAAIPIRNADSPTAAPETSPGVNSLLLSSQTPQRPKSPAKRRLTRNQTDGGDRGAISRSGELSSGSSDPSLIVNRKSPGSPRSVKRQKSGRDGSSSSISVSSPRRQTNAVAPLSSSNPEIGREDSPQTAPDSPTTHSAAPSVPDSPKPFSVISATQSPPHAPSTPASDSTVTEASESGTRTPDSVSAASSAASLNTSTLSNASATMSPSESSNSVHDATGTQSPGRLPPPLPTTPVPQHFRNHSLSALPPPSTPPGTPPGVRPTAGSISAGGGAGSPRTARLMSPRTASFSISRPAPPAAPFPGSAPATPSSPRAANGALASPHNQAQANGHTINIDLPPTIAETEPVRSPRDGNTIQEDDGEASPRLIDDETGHDEDQNAMPLSPLPPRLSQLPPPSPAMTH